MCGRSRHCSLGRAQFATINRQPANLSLPGQAGNNSCDLHLWVNINFPTYLQTLLWLHEAPQYLVVRHGGGAGGGGGGGGGGGVEGIEGYGANLGCACHMYARRATIPHASKLQVNINFPAYLQTLLWLHEALQYLVVQQGEGAEDTEGYGANLGCACHMKARRAIIPHDSQLRVNINFSSQRSNMLMKVPSCL